MNTNYLIEYRTSEGNLHIKPKGCLSEGAALSLTDLIREKYDGQGRVFINTHDLTNIDPDCFGIFNSGMLSKTLPPDRLFFKGEKGFELAPKGSRVLLTPKNFKCGCRKGCIKGRSSLPNELAGCAGKRGGLDMFGLTG